MRSTQQLIGEASQINAYLVREAANDLPTLMNTLVKLESYAARAHEMLAEAKSIKDETTRTIIEKDLFPDGLTPAIKAKYLNACLKDENYAIELIEGICSSVSDIMDSRRTRISAIKEELRQLRTPDMYRDR